MIVHGWVVKRLLVLVKKIVGGLGRFKEVFRYGFGRFNSDF
jgi:hypothetical protein